MKNRLVKAVETLGDYVRMTSTVIYLSVTHPASWELIRNQMFDIGVTSLPVVAVTGFSTGMVLAAQAFFQLTDLGVTSATGLMVTKAMLVELGPVLTAFMVTGRVGAAMCAELGTMRVTEQIDALKSMTVNPLWYLVVPRFLAGTFVLPLLTIFSCLMGIIGGYMVAVYYYLMPHNTYVDPLQVHIETFDVLSGLIKAIIFGIIIITISCYRGMTTSGGAAGVGKATTNSVVICYSVILISNFFLTVFLNNSHDFITEWMERWF